MDLEEQFYFYAKGAALLKYWALDIEQEFNNGKKVNKTKYNKLLRMVEERREKAEALLEKLNMRSDVKTVMPFIPPTPSPPPPHQNKSSKKI